VRRRLETAREQLDEVEVPTEAIELAAELCMRLGTDGLRGELTLIRAARALAALEGKARVAEEELRRMAGSALRHRLRRDPLDEAGSTARVQRAVQEQFDA
jgi:magnesium chelatase subunit I